MGVFVFGEFGRNLASLSRQFAASANRRFEFQKRRQQFIRVHNETFPSPRCAAAIQIVRPLESIGWQQKDKPLSVK
jgi:hypothetical protein